MDEALRLETVEPDNLLVGDLSAAFRQVDDPKRRGPGWRRFGVRQRAVHNSLRYCPAGGGRNLRQLDDAAVDAQQKGRRPACEPQKAVFARDRAKTPRKGEDAVIVEGEVDIARSYAEGVTVACTGLTEPFPASSPFM